MTEIKHDEYVQQLTSQIKHLLLFVTRNEIPKTSFYIK